MRLVAALVALSVAAAASAEEYRIGQPTEPISSPVHLTSPVSGQVEVLNLPPVQDVRVVEGGTLETPVEVRGEVSLAPGDPVPVEVVNPPAFPDAVEVEGAVRIDDAQPLRVWVENWPDSAAPASAAPAPRPYAAFALRGAFSSKESVVRRSFRAPAGAVFHLTDLVLDVRPDAVVRARVRAESDQVAGNVVTGGSGSGGLPLVVLDSRGGPVAHLTTPVPLGGDFVLEVEAPPAQGAPFSLVASGYLEGGEPENP